MKYKPNTAIFVAPTTIVPVTIESDRMLKEKYDKLTDDEKQSIKANQEKIANR